jgi:hypothetical protein
VVDVPPVAADLHVAAPGDVPGGHVEARQGGRRARQQRPLQVQGDLVLLLIAAQVRHRGAGAGRHVLEEGHVRLQVARARPDRQQEQGAGQLAGDDQRDHGNAVGLRGLDPDRRGGLGSLLREAGDIDEDRAPGGQRGVPRRGAFSR